MKEVISKYNLNPSSAKDDKIFIALGPIDLYKKPGDLCLKIKSILENIIRKNHYQNRLHGQIYRKYCAYGWMTQAAALKTDFYPFDRSFGQVDRSHRLVIGGRKHRDCNYSRER